MALNETAFFAAVAILLLFCFCVVGFRNAFAVGAADGSAADASSTGKVKVQPDVSKKSTVSSGKSEDGNPLIDWSVDARLQQIFGAVELSNLETASIKDTLDQRLKYLGVLVEDSRTHACQDNRFPA